MDRCCSVEATRNAERRRVLWIVLAINAVMFAAELVAGYLAGSVALQADALDMLGDTLVYGFSLAVVTRGPVWKGRAAMLKAGIMFAFAAVVLAQVVWKLVAQTVPDAGVVGAMGFVALAANLVCLSLLYHHRGDDINMRSTWVCSRNDIVANVAVMASAAAVVLTASMWPDVIVSLGIVALFIRSASGVAIDARHESRAARAEPRRLASREAIR